VAALTDKTNPHNLLNCRGSAKLRLLHNFHPFAGSAGIDEVIVHRVGVGGGQVETTKIGGIESYRKRLTLVLFQVIITVHTVVADIQVARNGENTAIIHARVVDFPATWENLRQRHFAVSALFAGIGNGYFGREIGSLCQFVGLDFFTVTIAKF